MLTNFTIPPFQQSKVHQLAVKLDKQEHVCQAGVPHPVHLRPDEVPGQRPEPPLNGAGGHSGVVPQKEVHEGGLVHEGLMAVAIGRQGLHVPVEPATHQPPGLGLQPAGLPPSVAVHEVFLFPAPPGLLLLLLDGGAAGGGGGILQALHHPVLHHPPVPVSRPLLPLLLLHPGEAKVWMECRGEDAVAALKGLAEPRAQGL